MDDLCHPVTRHPVDSASFYPRKNHYPIDYKNIYSFLLLCGYIYARIKR